MMSAWYETASRYGRDMTLYTEEEPQGVELRGFIKALDFKDAEKLRRSGQLGETDVGAYLYIGPPEPAPGDVRSAFLDCLGLRYAFKRAEPRIIGGQISHWEGIWRCLGAVEDA